MDYFIIAEWGFLKVAISKARIKSFGKLPTNGPHPAHSRFQGKFTGTVSEIRLPISPADGIISECS
jgi:hypothetical protein